MPRFGVSRRTHGCSDRSGQAIATCPFRISSVEGRERKRRPGGSAATVDAIKAPQSLRYNEPSSASRDTNTASSWRSPASPQPADLSGQQFVMLGAGDAPDRERVDGPLARHGARLQQAPQTYSRLQRAVRRHHKHYQRWRQRYEANSSFW